MFERATREKWRFQHRGILSVEALWDLSEQDLDSIYRNLSEQLQKQKTDGLMVRDEPQYAINTSNIEDRRSIVKRVFEVKREEAETHRQLQDKAERKRKILAIIADKQHTELAGKSVEELNAMLDDL